jgi:hypothetical protein
VCLIFSTVRHFQASICEIEALPRARRWWLVDAPGNHQSGGNGRSRERLINTRSPQSRPPSDLSHPQVPARQRLCVSLATIRCSIKRFQSPLSRKCGRSIFCQGLPRARHAQEHRPLFRGTCPARHLATFVGVSIVVVDLLHGRRRNAIAEPSFLGSMWKASTVSPECVGQLRCCSGGRIRKKVETGARRRRRAEPGAPISVMRLLAPVAGRGRASEVRKCRTRAKHRGEPTEQRFPGPQLRSEDRPLRTCCWWR